MIIAYLVNQTDPFQPSTDVVSFTSGIVAPEDITEDLQTQAKEENGLNDFVTSRLNSNDLDFSDLLKKIHLKTFSHTTRLKTSRNKKSTKTDFEIFARSLVIAQNRQLDLHEDFTYQLGQIPPSLDHQMKACAKQQRQSCHNSWSRK